VEKIEITVKSVKKREGTDRYTICFTLCGDGGTEEQSHVLLGAFLPFEVAVGDRLCAEEYEEFVRGVESSAAAYKGADLLDLGDHSQKMLCDKLRRKGFSAEAAERACSYLAKKGMLREGDYMVRCMEYLCTKKRYGPMRIRAELIRKGIRVSRYAEVYEQTMQLLDFEEALQKRVLQLRPTAFSAQQRQKTIAALQRCGFPLPMIRRALADCAPQDAGEDDF
jgi:SOS response regulatory protein OraA/RecX